MEPGMLMRIIMIASGVIFLCVTISSLARRKMTEPFCLTWGVISLMMILAGILLQPQEWNRYISGTGLLLILIIGFCVVYGAYFMSARVSELMRRNMELAMQVSLLNHENEEICKQLTKLSNLIGQEQRENEKNTGSD